MTKHKKSQNNSWKKTNKKGVSTYLVFGRSHGKGHMYIYAYILGAKKGKNCPKKSANVIYGGPRTASSATPKSREMGWIPR